MPPELRSAPDDVIAEHALRLGAPFEGIDVRVAALDEEACDESMVTEGVAPVVSTDASTNEPLPSPWAEP